MKGSLEVICGCMSSGKSEELIRRLRRATIAKQQVIVFKPGVDNRSESNKIESRNGVLYEAIPINDLTDIKNRLTDEIKVIAFDEVQFFAKDLVPLIRDLTASGHRIIAAGLDTDFRGEAFNVIAPLLAEADRVTKLDAVCMQCGGRATRSQRFINGYPAPHNAPQIVVGGDEMYEARCRTCHTIPR
ncbi:thymidine kinase [Candidatus Uhrbacteria bacterium]|nr:thymidine kinase [Candidatus Uhrbacteria bacterium]